MSASNIEQAKNRRRVALNHACDFISNELRIAIHINHMAIQMIGNENTFSDVLQSAGLDAMALNNPGTLVLYLEIPMATNSLQTCPVGSPNAGQTPAKCDQVVDDVRPSGSDWLPPLSIYRYGRTPKLDGRLAPCSQLLTIAPLVDAISDVVHTHNCPAPSVWYGTQGF